MRIAMHELRSLIGSLVLEAEGEPPDPSCDIKFVVGETIKLYRAVRIIPLEGGGFFGGEPRREGKPARARGTSIKELPPGTPCKVLKRKGGRAAWVQVAGISGPIRMDINKFCPTKSEAYTGGKKGKKAKGDFGPPEIMTPEKELVAAEKEHDDAAAAYAAAAERLEQARAAVTPAGEMEDDTPVDV